MENNRISEHPILSIPEPTEVRFYWKKIPLFARQNEMIATALIASGIKEFGRHHVDGSAQGIFCANGQCSKCMVIANGLPVKSCMTPVKANMIVDSVDGLPTLPDVVSQIKPSDIEDIFTDVLIIGGGPAGLSAGIELGRRGIKTLIIDDKHELGGKLVLQTHKFFGSVEDSQAGNRGIEIGQSLANTVRLDKNIDIWLNSTAIFVFKDRKVGILKAGVYKLVTPKVILNSAGTGKNFSSLVATAWSEFMVPGLSRPWSTVIWCVRHSDYSSSAAAMSA